MKYRIADLNVEMEPDETTKVQAKKYIYDFEKKDIDVVPGSYEKYKSIPRDYEFKYYQYLSCGREFYKKLLDYNGIMLHASAVVVDDKAYLFSAPCGTGKSTHTGLWLELFGDRAYILNDDKPAIRVMDDGIYAYGTPFSGKHDISENKKVKLQGICFIERSEKNYISPMDTVMAISRLHHASTRNLPAEKLIRELEVIDKIVKKIPIWKMGCLPDFDAVQLAYRTMSNKEVK